MAESFANLDNILRDWPKDKLQKVLPRLEQVREAGRRKIKPFLEENVSESKAP